MDKTVEEAIAFLYTSVDNPMAVMVADLVYSSLMDTLDEEVLNTKLKG